VISTQHWVCLINSNNCVWPVAVAWVEVCLHWTPFWLHLLPKEPNVGILMAVIWMELCKFSSFGLHHHLQHLLLHWWFDILVPGSSGPGSSGRPGHWTLNKGAYQKDLSTECCVLASNCHLTGLYFMLHASLALLLGRLQEHLVHKPVVSQRFLVFNSWVDGYLEPAANVGFYFHLYLWHLKGHLVIILH